MYMDDIKRFAKNEKELEILRSENIQPGHRDGIWYWKMRHIRNEKQETTPGVWNGTSKSRKN